MEQWQTEQLERLQKSEDKAYARRDEVEKAISSVIGEELKKNSFFLLRQLFSEYEDVETNCVKTTDRLTDFRSTL
jgi:hypothetical protein